MAHQPSTGLVAAHGAAARRALSRLSFDLTANTLWEAAKQLLGVGQMLARTNEDASDITALERIAAESDVGFRSLCARYVGSVIAASDPARVKGGASREQLARPAAGGDEPPRRR